MGFISHHDRVTHSPTYALARWYVNACGFSVLPLRPQSKQRLFPGTIFQTWMPRDDQLRKWFCTKQPYNVAIVPGEVSGNLVILDFDDIAVYQVWISLVPGAYDLPCVRSARGVHVYLRLKALPQGGKGMFDGLVFGDILTRGTIVAPPSRHPSGHQYTWEGDPRHVPLFSCLADLSVARMSPIKSLSRKQNVLPEKSYRDGPRQRIRNPRMYVQSAIIGEQRAMMQAVKGQRNHQLYRSALKLAKYLDIVSETEIETALERIALQAGLDQEEIRPTIRSGLKHGIENGVLRV